MYSPSLPHTEFPGKFFLSDLRNPLTRTDYRVTELFRLPSHILNCLSKNSASSLNRFRDHDEANSPSGLITQVRD